MVFVVDEETIWWTRQTEAWELPECSYGSPGAECPQHGPRVQGSLKNPRTFWFCHHKAPDTIRLVVMTWLYIWLVPRVPPGPWCTVHTRYPSDGLCCQRLPDTTNLSWWLYRQCRACVRSIPHKLARVCYQTFGYMFCPRCRDNVIVIKSTTLTAARKPTSTRLRWSLWGWPCPRRRCCGPWARHHHPLMSTSSKLRWNRLAVLCGCWPSSALHIPHAPYSLDPEIITFVVPNARQHLKSTLWFAGAFVRPHILVILSR